MPLNTLIDSWLYKNIKLILWLLNTQEIHWTTSTDDGALLVSGTHYIKHTNVEETFMTNLKVFPTASSYTILDNATH